MLKLVLFFNKNFFKISLSILSFWISTNLYAQKVHIKKFEQEFAESFKTKPKLDIKLDNRFSFIRAEDVKTLGVKFGLSFNRRFKVGIGVNQMITSTGNKISVSDTTLSVKLDYFYFSPYAEYTFYNSKKWAFSLATQLGFGEARYEYKLNNKEVELAKTLVLSYEPAMLIDYKIIRWFGIGTGVGYRIVYYKRSVIEEQFSSPQIIAKLKIYLGEIVRTISGKEWQIDD
mgnify:CR=1 FL=1